MIPGRYHLELPDIDCSYTKVIPLKKYEESRLENEYVLMYKINLQDLKVFTKQWVTIYKEFYDDLVEDQISVLFKNTYEA